MQIRIWWPIFFVVAVLATCVLIFPSELRLADLLGKSGKIDAAIAADLAALRRDPTRDDIRLHLCQLYISKGDLRQAVAQIDEIGIEKITRPHLLNQVADVYSQLGDRANTVATLERLTRLRPENPDYQTKLAEAYQWHGQTDEAIAIYETQLQASPDKVALLGKLIDLNLYLRRYEHARAHLLRLLDLQPDNAKARQRLGNVYLELNQPEFAVVAFSNALRANPENTALRQRLAELLIAQGEMERAIGHYERLYFDRVLDSGYFARLVDLTADRYPERAFDYYNLRLKYTPGDTALRHELAELYAHHGETDKAAVTLRQLADAFPQSSVYLEELAYLYQNMVRPELAEAAFLTLLESNPTHQAALDELRLYYLQQQDYGKLKTLYASLAGLGELAPPFATEYARLLVLEGQYESAETQLETTLAHTPDNVDARMQLTRLYLTQGKDEEAIQLLKQGADRYNPDDESFLLFAAQTLARENYVAQSIAIYERLVNLSESPAPYQHALLPLYIRNGDFNKAASVCEHLMYRDPDNPDLQFRYADVYWLQRDYDSMHRVIDEIQTAHKDWAALPLETGRFYFEHGFHEEAAEHLTQAVQDSASLRMLALAYAWSGKPEAAKPVFRKYHERHAGDYYTHYHLGVLLAENGDKQAATMEFRRTLTLLDSLPAPYAGPVAQEQTVVRAGALAYLGEKEAVARLYDDLLSVDSNDLTLHLQFARALYILQDYAACRERLQPVLQADPQNQQANQLLARSHLAEGDYKAALITFRKLAARHPDDLLLHIDLAETELLAGDWVSASRRLHELAGNHPDGAPAHQRLLQVRRQRNEAISAEIETQQQSDDFFRRTFRLIVSKAQSSLLSFKLLLQQDSYSSDQGNFADQEYQRLGFGLSSSGAKLHSEVTALARVHDGNLRPGGEARARWRFSAQNTLELLAQVNASWQDPLIAAFVDGSVDRLQSDLNLTLLQNLVLWNRFAYERHGIAGDATFSRARRATAQIGYTWPANLYTYYQFYHLDFDYDDANGAAILAIPEQQTLHYVGMALTRQLSGKFYFEVGGSVGYEASRNSDVLYGRLLLEYYLSRNLRLRSLVAVGNLESLSGRENDRTLSVDFYYFY